MTKRCVPLKRAAGCFAAVAALAACLWVAFPAPVVATQLQRFDIRETVLPSDSTISSKPYSFYEEHRGKIFTVATVAVAAPVLIFLLTAMFTARRKAEAKLRDSQQRLALTLDAVNEGVWDWRVATGETVFSTRYYTMLGYEPYAFPQSCAAWRSLIHPDDIERVEQGIRRHFAGGGQYTVEIRMRKKSGDWGWILARGMVVERDAAGLPLRMVGTHTDITEYKQAEIALKASEERYRALIESMGEGLVVIDNEAKVTYANPQFWVMTGFSAEELIGKPLENLLSENGKAAFHVQFERRKQRKPNRYELEWIKKGGGVVSTLISPRPLYDQEGRFEGSFAAISDVTELKRVEQELLTYQDHLEDLVRERTVALEQAKDAAEAANRAKSAFLANMSHELRTPLNAILGFSALMRRDAVATDRQRESLDIINRSGEHLLALINDILDMAKIEAGCIQMQLAPFDLDALTGHITDLMRARAAEKGLQLQLDRSPNLPRFIKGEEAKLRQVLLNLLSNAIKFTQQGGVTLRLDVLPDPDSVRLLIEVEDSGIGISAAEQERIFDPFVQAGQATNQHSTGLGLAITRQFVELMGGQIRVTSRLGRGSCFRIELPVEAVAESETPDAEEEHGEVIGLEPGQPDYRILIVEDQPENALLLSHLLEGAGFQTRIAENGAQGIALFQAWQPHFIWMDQRMPEMDGLETTRRIRALEGGGKVRIVALTASVFKEQHEEMLASGMDEIVYKPLQTPAIFDCLARHLGVRYAHEAGSAPAAKTALTLATPVELPEDLRRGLADALVALDTRRIDTLIERVAEWDAALGNLLRQHADAFDYEPIEAALQSASATSAATRFPD
ncbi:MAG: PAS domain S-box protein [Candidatus Contendobacter sp.]|nr:PAS domain S-box protein [Candidatus Contendobacter sp.]